METISGPTQPGRASRLAQALAVLILMLLGVIAWQSLLLKQQKDLLEHLNAALGEMSSSSADRVQSEANEATTVTKSSHSAASVGAGALPNSPTNSPSQDWRRLESEDYRTYIKNLRSVGCPEATIRDIISADLQSAFAARRAEIMKTRYQDFKYWQSATDETQARAELDRQRRALDAEANGALTDLLGDDFVPPSSEVQWRQAELDQQLAFLPSDKREPVKAALSRCADLNQQAKLLSQASRSPLTDPGERQFVANEFSREQAALAKLLTPEEFEQMDMTVSWTADNLRRGMRGFQPTEQEFQALFRAWRPHDELLVQTYAAGQPDPGNEAVYAKIREALGDERFQQYRTSWWKK